MKKKGNLISLISVIFLLLVGMTMTGCVPALHNAAVQGDINEVRRLIEQGADAKDVEQGLTAAAYYGKFEIVKFLIDRGVDERAKSRALYEAISGRNTDIAKYLIEKGADLNTGYGNGMSPLREAAFKGNIDMVKILIEKGADIDVVLAELESFAITSKYAENTAKAKAGIKLLEKFAKKQEIASQPAIAASKPSQEVSPITKSDVDKPFFGVTDKIMGDNDMAVVIGVEKYQDLPASDYSSSDEKIVKEYLVSLGVKERNIELLLNERATQSSIKKTVETWLPNRIKSDSKVVIYYSGHGAPEPKTGDAYIVPFDGDPNYLEDTGYSLKRLYDKLGKLQAAEVVVLLDSCFSGSGGRSVLAKGARPLVMMAEGGILSQNMAVLSATQGTQISTSSPEKGHGVFTYYFLKALKDGKKNLSDIYEYIKPLVEDEAKQLNVQQSPNISPDVEKLKGR
ncbi:MAG: ankyrin repeat domain-containing protein, partial [Nitrospirae bacterium]|nr:ankyrin repeat domain-containing protein [Nitrospirota bacterium]